jgi:pyruvate-formate lyase-activating enzyme
LDYLPRGAPIFFAAFEFAASHAAKRLRAEAHGATTPKPLRKKADGFELDLKAPAERLVLHLCGARMGSSIQSLSAASSSRFLSTPQRYPVSDPSAPTTR